MRQYNVAETANLLNVNEETVRRWIRSGELKANKTSNKNGNVIDECDLHAFVRTRSKYRTMLGLQESTVDSTYFNELNGLLKILIGERDRLNDRINKIQTLLEES